MKSFQINKILIPVDFSETSLLAIEHGSYMARLYDAGIILLNVIKPHLFDMSIMDPTGTSQWDKDEWEKHAKWRLEKLAGNIKREYGIEPEVMCETGNICKTIVKTAEEKKADMIIMGTHGASGFEEKFIGSNAYKVVNQSSIPVITVQNHITKKGFSRIVMPIDHSEYSRQKVRYAISLAAKFGASIHILGLLEAEDAHEQKKLEIKISQVKAILENYKIPYSVKIEYGVNFGILTLNYALKNDADLIVIMTEWEEELTGFFIWPFARQVVNHSKIPVLSIHPEVRAENIPNVHPY